MNLRHEIINANFEKWHCDGNPVHGSFHVLTGPDPDPLPHDHQADFHSFIVEGGYVERIWGSRGYSRVETRGAFDSFWVPAETIHRIERIIGTRCVTFVTFEPHRRKWFNWDFRPEGPFKRQQGTEEWVKI